MSKALAITAGALASVWLISIAVQLFFVAGLIQIAALIGAIVAQVAVFLVTSAIMLTTNTRRPAGIDPNAPNRNRVDPFSLTTDELRQPVIVGDRPYGRRAHDDTAVVQRLIDRLEKDDVQRPPPASGTPTWALDLMHDQPDEAKEA